VVHDRRSHRLADRSLNTYRTKPNSRWALKLALVALVLAGAGGWFLYDGWIGFPHHNERLKVFNTLGGDADAWVQHARSHGWQESTPDPKPYGTGHFYSQWFLMGLCWLLSAALLGRIGMRYRWPIGYDDEVLIGPFNRRIPFDAIQQLDKSRWDTTGLATLGYEHNGQTRSLRIDDYVFEGAYRVLEEVERRTGLGDSLGD
jgi:hypothetical protein